ncbi:unnamed protein product, partial [Rotaria sp. Silwood2]
EIYQADCLRLFHQVIDHSLLINDIQQHIKEQAFQDICQLYEQRFSEQYCPLTSIDEKKKTRSNLSHDNSDYENPFSFTDADIIIDMNWLDFCKQFMANPKEPLKYVADCIRLVGYVNNHSPWSQIDDDTMKKSCDKTNDIWKEEFDSDITTNHV